MRIKGSITKKLFIITSIIFIAFISSMLITQSLFFEKFYISRKKSDIQKNTEKFKINYNKTNNIEYMTTLIKNFEDNNNAKIVILDNLGQIKFVTKSGNERVESAKVRVINQIVYEWVSDSRLIRQLKLEKKTITYISDKEEQEIKNIVCVTPDNERNEIIFVLSSLQPINEASMVIKEFYLYFYIVAIFLIIVLSLIYSNMVAKPLIKINKTASKMAKLNFNEKCEINSDDEIGSLSQSLNFLSENLDSALNSLRQANAKLEEDIEKERKIEKNRKEFVAAVSHELKTPITLIDGYAEGLKDDIFEEKDRIYYIDVIIDEARKMGNLVSDMLDLSQFESGAFKLLEEEFFIDELIKTTVKKFSAVMKDKNIGLRLNLIEKVKVKADWNRIEQVITNYFINAIKNTYENGKILIEMKEQGEYIIVSVENEGNNIPEEELCKIWDTFYKIDKSRSRKLGGTGIGLAIVKNIIFLHNGSVGVENTNTGVKFFFQLYKL